MTAKILAATVLTTASPASRAGEAVLAPAIAAPSPVNVGDRAATTSDGLLKSPLSVNPLINGTTLDYHIKNVN